MVNAGRGNVDVFGKSWKGQNCGHSWDALIQVFSGTALRGCHTKQHRTWMHIKSLFQQSLCGKAKNDKILPCDCDLAVRICSTPLLFCNVLFLSSQKASLAKGSCQPARSGQRANGSIQLYAVAPAKLSIQKKSHSFDSGFSSGFITLGPLPI